MIFCPLFYGLCGSGPNVICVGVVRYQIPEVYSRNRLIGMCCWMGSHFHDSIDFNGVTISTESLEWGRKLSRFWIMQCNFFLFFFFIFVFDSHSLRENDFWLCKYYNKWRKWKAGAKWREWKKGSRQHAQGTLFSN